MKAISGPLPQSGGWWVLPKKALPIALYAEAKAKNLLIKEDREGEVVILAGIVLKYMERGLIQDKDLLKWCEKHK